jgi:hypothetical protein
VRWSSGGGRKKKGRGLAVLREEEKKGLGFGAGRERDKKGGEGAGGHDVVGVVAVTSTWGKAVRASRACGGRRRARGKRGHPFVQGNVSRRKKGHGPGGLGCTGGKERKIEGEGPWIKGEGVFLFSGFSLFLLKAFLLYFKIVLNNFVNPK